MAEYRAKGGRGRTFGNTLREIASSNPAPLTTASLCIDGSYHVDTLVRPVNRVQSDTDPQLMSQSGRGSIESRSDELKLPGQRVPNPRGWQSTATPPGQE